MLIAAVVLAVLPQLRSVKTSTPTPSSTAATLQFELHEISLRQRLAQYPSTVEPAWQGASLSAYRDHAQGFTMLTVPDRYLGRQQLLVVRCPPAAAGWQAQMFSSTYGNQSISAAGRCGQIGTATVPAGIGAVSVQVDAQQRFAAALLVRR